jgi:hypothetical protein
MAGVDKGDLVAQFTDGRTEHLHEMREVEYRGMLVAMEGLSQSVKGGYAEMDTARKRVIAAIGAWLRGRNMDESMGMIKGIACRAAKAERFNDIPLSKLRALYEEWRNKNKIGVEVASIARDVDDYLEIMN